MSSALSAFSRHQGAAQRAPVSQASTGSFWSRHKVTIGSVWSRTQISIESFWARHKVDIGNFWFRHKVTILTIAGAVAGGGVAAALIATGVGVGLFALPIIAKYIWAISCGMVAGGLLGLGGSLATSDSQKVISQKQVLEEDRWQQPSFREINDNDESTNSPTPSHSHTLQIPLPNPYRTPLGKQAKKHLAVIGEDQNNVKSDANRSRLEGTATLETRPNKDVSTEPEYLQHQYKEKLIPQEHLVPEPLQDSVQPLKEQSPEFYKGFRYVATIPSQAESMRAQEKEEKRAKKRQENTEVIGKAWADYENRRPHRPGHRSTGQTPSAQSPVSAPPALPDSESRMSAYTPTTTEFVHDIGNEVENVGFNLALDESYIEKPTLPSPASQTPDLMPHKTQAEPKNGGFISRMYNKMRGL